MIIDKNLLIFLCFILLLVFMNGFNSQTIANKDKRIFQLETALKLYHIEVPAP